VFGDTLADPVTGFTLVYGIEIWLLLATIIAIGPLARRRIAPAEATAPDFGVVARVGLNPGGLQ
jgi:BCD family chlorophyll transporter-like MFS transporter